MGGNRNKRKRPQNLHPDQIKKGWGNSGPGYADIVKENEKFEKYYKEQGIVPEEQWQSFMNCLRESLPCTFRITGCRSEAKALLKIVESDFLEKLVGEDTTDGPTCFEKPFSLPWYPDKLAWQLNLTRKILRKSEVFGKLHHFLVSETGSGNISRQEAVSMIPPVVLGVKPHHRVLDMCAAPGSKTSQLIEMLHTDDQLGVPDGVVVANDMDNKRCYMLVHQVKRLQSPSLVITNHDAGAMPNIKLQSGKNLEYDRILCDVPCSGDGTLRKNIDIWKKWNPANSLNFHCLQARILKRGLELLNIGGRLVYSTCSLSPIEDESVIHHMLKLCEGSVQLVDISGELPGLQFSHGLSCWKVLDRDLNEIKRPDDIDPRCQSYIRPNYFPPNPEDSAKFQLDRCIRVLPHVQNTGGFFVALLEKTKSLPWESSRSAEPNARTNAVIKEEPVIHSPASKKKKTFGSGYREDPFVYLNPDEQLWPPVRDYYKISTDLDHTLLLTRTLVGMKRTLYFTGKLVKEIVTCNEGHLKVINTGIRVFHRSDKKGSHCDFRLVQEGLKTLLPFMKGRVVYITKEDVVTLLTHDFPFFAKLSAESKRQCQELGTGSITLIHKGEGFEANPIVLCGWNGQVSLRAYLRKDEKIHILRLCGVDTAKYERKKFNTDPAAANADQTPSTQADPLIGEDGDDGVIVPEQTLPDESEDAVPPLSEVSGDL